MLQRFGRPSCPWSRAPRRVGSLCPTLRRNSHASASSPPETATPVEKIIIDSIRASGPIPLSTYIQLCLSHPTEGYYMKQLPDDKDVFGVQGDFITSPEISQVFGELVCLWFLSVWGYPSTGMPLPKIRIVELGPGRGTLMGDMIRTISMFPSSRDSITGIHMVENSLTMRSRQLRTLTATELSPERLHWYDSIEDIPDAAEDEFTMVVAHEFFDALPKTDRGFREVMIDLQPSGNIAPVSTPVASPKFRFVVSPDPTARSELLSSLSPRFATLPAGARVEVSNVGWRIARRIGEMVSGKAPPSADPKGAALIIDYGDERAFGASFRAFKAHRHVDVFENPGACDLTTNVDFALLKEAVGELATTHPTLDQAAFLVQMGLYQRLKGLMDKAPSLDRRLQIERAGKRLVDKSAQGMGKVYRMMGITGNATGTVETWPFIKLQEKKAISKDINYNRSQV